MGDTKDINETMIGDPSPPAPADGYNPLIDSIGSRTYDRQCGASVLVVAGEPRMRRHLQGSLEPRFALVESAGDILTANALLARCHFDLLISTIRLPERFAPEWVKELRNHGNTTDVLFVANRNDSEGTKGILNDGRSCLIFEPFEPEQLLVAIGRCSKQRQALRQSAELPNRLAGNDHPDRLVGECPEIIRLRAMIERVAPLRSTLLIQGESGTGKEVAARAIHTKSRRRGHFVAVNCGALPNDLLETELFGHIKGAFTGAHQGRDGLIKYAHGGTLFLDEISEMPLQMQAKLLRVFEDKSIRPVGANREVAVDLRILAATNRDLEQAVAEHRFRSDLFYRLSVLALRVPLLRDRPGDIPLLARHFLASLAAEMGIPLPAYDDEALKPLRHYEWPGNVRELRNVIERSLLLGLPPSQCIRGNPIESTTPIPADSSDVRLTTVEKRHIRTVLQDMGGNKSETARQLGISRKTLERKLKAWAAQDDTASSLGDAESAPF